MCPECCKTTRPPKYFFEFGLFSSEERPKVHFLVWVSEASLRGWFLAFLGVMSSGIERLSQDQTCGGLGSLLPGLRRIQFLDLKVQGSRRQSELDVGLPCCLGFLGSMAANMGTA